jgi:hypothetical protein
VSTVLRTRSHPPSTHSLHSVEAVPLRRPDGLFLFHVKHGEVASGRHGRDAAGCLRPTAAGSRGCMSLVTGLIGRWVPEAVQRRNRPQRSETPRKQQESEGSPDPSPHADQTHRTSRFQLWQPLFHIPQCWELRHRPRSRWPCTRTGNGLRRPAGMEECGALLDCPERGQQRCHAQPLRLLDSRRL